MKKKIAISVINTACAKMVKSGECSRGDQICEDNGLYCPRVFEKTADIKIIDDTSELDREKIANSKQGEEHGNSSSITR